MEGGDRGWPDRRKLISEGIRRWRDEINKEYMIELRLVESRSSENERIERKSKDTNDNDFTRGSFSIIT